MDHYQVGDSIECKRSEIITKRFSKGILKYHPTNGRRYMFYKCERSSSAEITEELNPKDYIIEENSYLNLEDKLYGDKLHIYIDNKKRLKPEHIGGHTGRHGSQKFETRNFTFAQIKRRYDTVPFRQHNNSELP